MTCGDTQVVIRTNQLLLILTREVRWQAEISQVVIRTNALLLILTREVRWQAEIPQVVIRTHIVLLPRPVRNQVACGDVQYDNMHTFQK